jgi:hypothetical protein
VKPLSANLVDVDDFRIDYFALEGFHDYSGIGCSEPSLTG